MITEYLNFISFLTIYIRHIYHTHIHTDISHIRSFLSVHQTIGMTIAQMAVQTIGIPNRDSCYFGITV